MALRRFDKRSPPGVDTTAKLLGTVFSIPGLVTRIPPAAVANILRPALAVALTCVASPPNNIVDTSLRTYLDATDDVEGLIGNLLDLAKPLIQESTPELLVC